MWKHFSHPDGNRFHILSHVRLVMSHRDSMATVLSKASSTKPHKSSDLGVMAEDKRGILSMAREVLNSRRDTLEKPKSSWAIAIPVHT